MSEPWPDELSSYRPPCPPELKHLDFKITCAGDGGKCGTPAKFFVIWHDTERCLGHRLRMKEALFCDTHLKALEKWSEQMLSKRNAAWWGRWFRGNAQRCRCGRTIQLFTDVLTITRPV